MKILIISVLLLSHHLALALFNPQQQVQAVEQLNDICADSWCESATDFVFKKMDCDYEKGQCVLEFTTQENFSPNQPFENGQCLITEIQSNEQLFDYVDTVQSSIPMGFLKASFMDQVNRCLNQYMK